MKIDKKSNIISMIVPYLTFTCNRVGNNKCPNCFSEMQGVNSGIMSEEVFEKLCKWSVNFYNNNIFKNQTFIFASGEPLTVTNKIKRLIDYNLKYLSKDIVSGVVWTNGDLIYDIDPMDLENVQIINLNITNIDLDEIKNRIDYIRKYFSVYQVRLIATLFDLNLNRFEDIIRFAMENNLDMRIYKDIYKPDDEEYKDKLIQEWHKIINIIKNDYIRKGKKITIPFLYDGMVANWPYDKSPYSCGKGIVTVFPDGSIGNCIRNMDKKVGTLDDPNPQELIKEDHMKWSFINNTNTNEECKTCSVRFACQGGCPQNRILSGGYYEGKDPWCRVHKEILPRVRDLGKEINKPDATDETYSFAKKIGAKK